MEIEKVDEAIKLLRTLVERGEKLMEGVTLGPLDADVFGPVAQMFNSEGGETVAIKHLGENAPLADAERFLATFKMFAASRSLVPAMVKGAEAVLDLYDKHVDVDLDELNAPFGGGIIHTMKALANAYRPAMVDLGWWTE